MKRYLRGWIYSKIVHEKKLVLLGLGLLFYIGLFLSPPLSASESVSNEMSEESVICMEEIDKTEFLK